MISVYDICHCKDVSGTKPSMNTNGKECDGPRNC